MPGLANLFQVALQGLSSQSDLGFVSRNRSAFQETHRDFYSSRAPLQAAFTAQAFGAELAVTVGAPLFERHVSVVGGFGARKRLVRVSARLRAMIYDAATAELLSTHDSRRYDAVRVEPADEDLVELEDDPDVASVLIRGVTDISPGVATDLALLAGRIQAERFTLYTCESGFTLSAAYPGPELAQLRYRGQELTLQITPAASGARYTGDGLIWWIRGDEASLFRITDEGEIGERLELCQVDGL